MPRGLGARLYARWLYGTRGHAWCGYAGFDYEAQGDLPVYFEVLFYGLLEGLADVRLHHLEPRKVV